MKHFLLPTSGNYYKANLHTHTTVSDGRSTPEEVKQHYYKNGYSIVAFTDHDVFVPHNDLTDESFLALNGVEIGMLEQPTREGREKCCHLCFIAMDASIDAHPLWEENMDVDKMTTTFPLQYSPECVCEIMRQGQQKRFFITYNHPRWSLENYAQYSRYENMDAMEIYNHGCIVEGFFEYNDAVYDDLLRCGKKLYAIATDDMHRLEHACGGYIMVNAEKLEYGCVTAALKKGQFYASTGPQIHSLWFDDETRSVHIETSKAKKIICSTGMRRQYPATAKDQNCEYITEATFALQGNEQYVRLTVIDENTGIADTNAYFLEDLML